MVESRGLSRSQSLRREDEFRALSALQLTAWDSSKPLVGRQKHISRLTDELRRSVTSKTGGPGHLFYLCGQPGTGKTATTRYVLENLRREYKNVDYHEINALSLSSVNQLFSEIYRCMYPGARKGAAECHRLLSSLFRSSRRKLKHHQVFVIDEFDNLTATCSRQPKSYDKLYEIFDWTHEKYANITLICIANNMALPDTVVPRCGSRLGNGIIAFDTYSWQELLSMLDTRIERHVVERCFEDANTLVLLSRKVAARSGDARSYFTLLHSLVSEYQRTHTKITSAAVIDAFRSMFRDESSLFVEELPTHARLVLASFILVCEKSTATAQAIRVWQRFESEMKENRLARCLFYDAVEMLISARIIRYVLALEHQAVSRNRYASHANTHDEWGQWAIILMPNITDVIEGLKVSTDMRRIMAIISEVYKDMIDLSDQA